MLLWLSSNNSNSNSNNNTRSTKAEERHLNPAQTSKALLEYLSLLVVSKARKKALYLYHLNYFVTYHGIVDCFLP